MNKKTILLLTLITFLISGCSIFNKKDKIDTIAQYEVKKEYVLPKLDSCESPGKWEDGTFESLYKWGIDVKQILKNCNQYNNEKKEWIERNFKND